MTQMHNPPHPGETLREDVLPALGLSVTDAAGQLRVTRPALSRVLNGRAAAVTLKPSAGNTSSRKVSPGCGGLCISVIRFRS